jgi:hypothetical protein
MLSMPFDNNAAEDKNVALLFPPGVVCFGMFV